MAVSEYVDDDVSCNRNEAPLALEHHEIMGCTNEWVGQLWS
jgi:hypothetical protein